MRFLSVGAKAFIKIGDITYKALAIGTAGNDISVVLADNKIDGSAAIDDVTAGVITIGIQGGVTLASAIKAAIAADTGEGGAGLLIEAIIDSGEESAAQAAASETSLSSGLNANAVFHRLGAVMSSLNRVINHASETVAGVAYRLKSDETLTTALADGELQGVSLGYDSQVKKSRICTKGIDVPIRLTAGFEPEIGAPVYIDDVTGYANIVDDGTVTTTISNAVYKTGMISGEVSQGVEIPIALIDFTTGL